jgi:hypothetical protein
MMFELRFIYTGEVFVPQHELQGFLRTAELLEIKGLLKDVDEVSWPQPGTSQTMQQSSNNNNNNNNSLVQSNHSKLNLSQSNSNNGSNGMLGNSNQNLIPSLPTVPVSTIVLTNQMAESEIFHINVKKFA